VTLIYLSIAWLLGILVTQALSLPLASLGFLVLPAIFVLVSWPRNARARFLAVCLLGAAAGGVRLQLAPLTPDANDVVQFADMGQIAIVGAIARPPETHDNYQQFPLKVTSAAVGSCADVDTTAPPPAAGTLLVRTDSYEPLTYGDSVCVTGAIQQPLADANSSYGEYLARQRIFATMPRAYLDTLEPGRGSIFWAALYNVKGYAHQVVQQILPEPYAALLAGILLGIDSGIPKDLYEQFNAVGASHIIVISGSNIAVVCALLMTLSIRLLGKRKAAWLTLAGVALYTLFVGADPPVVRAAIMGSLSVLAIYLGREGEARTMLMGTALLMTAVNPHLVNDVGFQLSFAATAGLVWIAPPLERGAQRMVRLLLGAQHTQAIMRLISEVFLITLAAQVAVTPLLLYHFGRFSPISLLTNLLIVPVQPFILLIGGAATAAGMFWLPLGRLLGSIVWLPLAWTVFVVKRSAALPWASLPLHGMTPALTVFAYAALALAVWWIDRHLTSDDGTAPSKPPVRLRTSTRWVLTAGAALAFLIWAAVGTLPDGRLHVTFLDVGQGDAILITTPKGQQILVDGGPAPSVLLWRLGEHMPFWDRTVEMVINTHPDIDHLGGLPAVLDRYHVPQVLLSDIEDDSSAWAALNDAAAQQGAQTQQAQAGGHLYGEEGLAIDILHPGAVPVGGDSNSHSIVLRVAYGDVSFLLTGDIEADTEKRLGAAGLLPPTTVVKAPHHGSAFSSSRSLIATTQPQLAIISAGEDNLFGHPADEVLQRYAEASVPLLRTDQVGTIDCWTDGRTLWVRTERPLR
jgi:competence protein ComEC